MTRPFILSLCDYTGVWSAPYREAGYKVLQIDLKHGEDARLWPSRPSEKHRTPNEFEDIREYIGKVRGVLAAPVCTVFAGSGARWPRSDAEIREGLALVDACVRLDWVLKPDFFALENPVGKLTKWLGPCLYSFQPYEFGDPYTKRTCLYGRFNTNLKKHNVPAVEGSRMWSRYGGRSEYTKQQRSITPSGFARAFYEANP